MKETDKASFGGGKDSSNQATNHTDRTGALYYGGPSRLAYYGGGMPAAYGASAYGGNDGEAESSLVGSLSLLRVFRVCTQRWVTITVFIIVGVVVSLAVFRMSPQIYEAESVFEMSMRQRSSLGIMRMAGMDAELGSAMDEVFNTRLARLRSRAIFEQVLRQYRTDYSSSTATDKELIQILVDSKMTLVRRSRLIRLSARSTDPQLATDLVNAYAKTAELFTTDLNKNKSDIAVSWLVATTEALKRELERMDKDMLDFRVANQLDLMASETAITQQALTRINAEIIELESGVAKTSELLKTLETIQSDPEKFGSLPDSVPRSLEIGTAFQMLQRALAEKNSLLNRYTANHPDVKAKEKDAEIYAQQFADVVFRALETCKANFDLQQRQLMLLVPKRDELTRKLSDTELKIVPAQLKMAQMERAREVGDINYKSLLQRTSEARLAADENTAIIEPLELATVPQKFVLPNPWIIFPAGPILGLILGVLFVLVLDHLEDKVVGISDIEQRLRLKTLAVLPHVRRKKREQLARLVLDDEFSQFAEAVAGLRNLLDSPRYQEMSKIVLCMSTQPGEGKTITSCSLATSSARSDRRTLLVDFDMRRPRLATIYEKKPEEFNSLPHTLKKADPALFDTLPIASGVKNMDIILSKGASDVNPASLMGSGIISEFFAWARTRYDRVVVDSPPFGIVGDVMTLAPLVDAVMIMCCPDRTRFQLIKHASRHLAEAGARVVGVIVNDVDIDRTSSFSSYDYRYNSRYSSRYGAYSYYGYGQSRKRAGKGKKAKPVAVSDTNKLANEDDLTPLSQNARPDIVDVSMTDDE